MCAQQPTSHVTLASVERRLIRAAELMDEVLSRATGLMERERKLATYYALATHALPHVKTFSLLALIGKMGTGKSQTLKIIGKFSRHPHSFSLRNMTLPTIRDELAKCDFGTAIIEEADQAWGDKDMAFERLLSDRFQLDSAKAALKQKSGDKWASVNRSYFGATVLHRRMPFSDAALDGRTVTLQIRADHSRKYEQYCDEAAWIGECLELTRDLTFKPPVVEQPANVAARIFDPYRILLSTASLCGDEGFLGQILPRLILQTAELKEAQAAEPDGLVLRAILEAMNGASFRNIRVSVLVESIFKENKIVFQPRQVAGLARQLGLETRQSHGVTCVIPDPVKLLVAVEQIGYEDDEAIAELRLQVLGSDE